MEAQRGTRLVILLTKDEMAELRRRAGLAAVSVWARAQLLPTTRVAESSGRVEPEAGSPKISEAAVEVEQRSVPRRTGTIRKIEDVTHAVARKHLPEAAGTPSPGGKETGRCNYLVPAGTKCPRCKEVHTIR